MSVDYKKELENAARSMILEHKLDNLIKMVVRMLAQKVKVTHASILLHDKYKDAYILTLSRGSLRAKIPVGLTRMDKDDPLIRFFKEHKNRILFDSEAIVYKSAKEILNNGNNIENKLKQMLSHVLYQMELLDTIICIPGFFRDDLLVIILLGCKKNGKDFKKEELSFLVALASNIAMAIKNAQLFKELESELDKKHQLFIRTTIALAAAIEAKDHYTHGHTTRVTNLSLEIARRLKQKDRKICDERFFENIRISSLLHDIGKIGVPEYILNKKGELTIGERNRIKAHPLIGVAILKPIKELEPSLVGVKYHHERYDGAGYPEGLKGEEIPLIASIISVADSFDAMTRDRPYRLALQKNDAITEIQRLSGRQFNPRITAALTELCQEGKI